MPFDIEKPTNLDQLYVYLKRFSLSDSLFVIGVINAAVKYGLKQIQKDDIPEPVTQWLETHCKTKEDLVAMSLHLTRLARFLILSGTNDFKEPILDVHSEELHTAINLTSSLWDKEAEGEIGTIHDVSTVFGRIGQWQFPLQSSRADIMGRAYLLFIEIPENSSSRYNFCEKMKEYYGLSVFQYIASGLALWIMTVGVLKHNLTIEVDELKNYVTTKTLGKFVELSSGTAEDYRRHIRGDAWKTSNKLYDIYGLDPFIFMPAIRAQRSRVNHEPICYMVPQPFYLLQRASLGVFYLLADKERGVTKAAGQNARNDFRDVFGEIYRAYIGKNLALGKWPTILIDLDSEIAELPGILKPDFALIEGPGCVLFEVKTAPFSVTSRTVLDKEKAKEEIQREKGTFKKALDQLNTFEDAILQKKISDKRFENITSIVKVVVIFEDIFIANAFLLPIAKEVYGEQSNNLQIMGITDIESLGKALSQDVSIVQNLIKKLEEVRTAEEAVGPTIVGSAGGENPLLKESYEKLMKRLVGKERLSF